MKKVVVVLILAALIAGAILYFKPAGVESDAAQSHARLVPADAIAFLELPDFAGTAERWKETALAKIAAEEEVAAFLELPRANLQTRMQAIPLFGQLQALGAKSAFFSVLSMETNAPKLLAGLRFSGDKEALDAALAEARAQFIRRYPAAATSVDAHRTHIIENVNLIEEYGHKTSVDAHRTHIIESAATEQITVASVVIGDMYLVATDPAVLREAVDRLDGEETGSPSLAEADLFLACLGKVPADREAFTYVWMEPVAERLLAMMEMGNQPMTPEQKQGLESMEAIVAATGFQGGNLHEKMFVKTKPGAPRLSALGTDSLMLTTSDTILFYASVMQLPESFELSDSAAADPTGMLSAISGWMDRMDEKGVTPQTIAEAFGEEFSLTLDWDALSAQPTLLASLEVENFQKANDVLEAIAATAPGREAPAMTDVDGAKLLIFPGTGMMNLSPSMALTNGRILFALDGETATNAIALITAGESALAANPAYLSAMQGLVEANSATGYVDTKAFFERAYTLLRPALLFGGALIPGAAENVDFNKLPATETISQHLGPIAYTGNASDEGYIYESTGPITMNQLIFLIVGGAVGFGIQQSLGQ